MQMGKDILFFWACRMLLMTSYRADSIPWKDIYFTGLVRDKDGQKMSKSRGNGIEPAEVIEKYGTDALRLAMTLGNSPGADVNIGEESLSGASRYTNKIWNAGKLVAQRVEELSGGKTNSPDQISLKASEWILGEIDKFRTTTRQHFEDYRPDLAAAEIYKFTRNIFCDRYLEVLKVQANTLENPQERAEAAWVALESFRNILQLNHPIVPFVTEEVSDLIPQIKEQNELLAASTWRQEPYLAGNASSDFGALLDLAAEVRRRRASLEIPPGDVVRVAFPEDFDAEAVSVLETLARISIQPQKDIDQSKSINQVTELGSFIIEHSDKDRYLQRLEKDIEKVEERAEKLQKGLNPQFIQRAPEHIVNERQAQLQEAQELRAKLIEQLQDIEN
jgi:valyl-tRNA synthetase